jgi:hypothetical protein
VLISHSDVITFSAAITLTSVQFPTDIYFFFLILDSVATMPFDWQAELSSTTALSPAVRVRPPPNPISTTSVSFAQV